MEGSARMGEGKKTLKAEKNQMKLIKILRTWCSEQFLSFYGFRIFLFLPQHFA